MQTNLQQSVTSHCEHRSLRFPAFITLGPSVTTCSRCPVGTLVLAAVIDGLERRLDPLPLSLDGLAAAATEGRYVAVVRPFGAPMANRATTGHWWVKGLAADYRPTLLAEHRHGTGPLDHDPALASALLARFLPDGAQVPDDAPPPF